MGEREGDEVLWCRSEVGEVYDCWRREELRAIVGDTVAAVDMSVAVALENLGVPEVTWANGRAGAMMVLREGRARDFTPSLDEHHRFLSLSLSLSRSMAGCPREHVLPTRGYTQK